MTGGRVLRFDREPHPAAMYARRADESFQESEDAFWDIDGYGNRLQDLRPRLGL